MQISITGRHFTVTEPIKEYIEEKFLRLDKYKDKIIEAHVILSVEKYRHHAEISLAAKGSNIIVNAESENMYASIDKVLGKIQTKIRRRSERLKERSLKNIREFAGFSEGDSSFLDEDSSKPKLVGRRKIGLKPMSVDEAVLQMGLNNNNFLVFRNAGTSQVNVIYRKEDSNYGLIET